MTRLTLIKVGYTTHVIITNNTECTELYSPTFKYKRPNNPLINKQTYI